MRLRVKNISNCVNFLTWVGHIFARQKNHYFIIMRQIFLITLILSLFACRKALSPNSVVDQNAIVRHKNDLDDYIRREFTEPYGIEVVYNWERNFTDNKHAFPTDLEHAQQVLETIKELWLNLYTLSDVGGENFMKGKNPIRIRLYGGQNMREAGRGTDNLVELIDGSTESPIEMAIYNVNNFDISSADQVFGLMQTVHHQFAKRLFDLFPFDKQKFIQFSGISQYITELREVLSYTSTSNQEGKNQTKRKTLFGLDNAVNREGFFTVQARLSPESDLAETIATMLNYSSTEISDALARVRNNQNAIGKGENKDDDDETYARLREEDFQGEKTARASYQALSQKRQFAIDYLQQSCGLSLVKMQLLASANTKKWLNNHKKTN